MALQLKTEKDSLAEGTRNTGLNNESENSLNNGWLTDSEPYVVGSDVTEEKKTELLARNHIGSINGETIYESNK